METRKPVEDVKWVHQAFEKPVRYVLVWVQLTDQTVCTAKWIGWAWSIDAERSPSGIDDEEVVWWADITYPKGRDL